MRPSAAFCSVCRCRKLGGHEVLAAMLEEAEEVVAEHPAILMIADKGSSGRRFEQVPTEDHHFPLLRPSRKNEKKLCGEPLLKSVRQLIESANDTLRGQLHLEQHRARTFEGVAIRVAQRILALAAAIWHNVPTGQPISRSLTAYDHEELLV